MFAELAWTVGTLFAACLVGEAVRQVWVKLKPRYRAAQRRVAVRHSPRPVRRSYIDV